MKYFALNKILHSSLLSVVVAVIIYAVIAVVSDGKLVWQALTSLDLSIWLIILLLSLCNYCLRYWRWHLYVTHHATSALSHCRHIAIYIAGFSLTMTPGKTGEAIRCLYLKPYGVPHSTSLAAFFIERMMDLFTILLMAGLGLMIFSSSNTQIAAIVAVVIIVACILLVKIPKQKIMQSRLLAASPVKVKKAVAFIETFLENAGELLSWRLIGVGLGIGILAWLLEGYGLYLVMQAYSSDLAVEVHSMKTGINAMGLAVGVYGAAILLGALSMSPGGLGASEFAMAYLLYNIGFDMPSAVAITYICRIVTLWFAVLLGLLTMFTLSFVGRGHNDSNNDLDSIALDKEA